jgi:hypothetical protein
MRPLSSAALRAAFALLVWAVYHLAGQGHSGTLRVEIRDGPGGSIVPAMVCITSMQDGTWRTPPDGSVSPPFSTVPDFMDPKPWRPGDVGPVRPAKVPYRHFRLRSFSYEDRSAYPFWQDPAAYFVSQPFVIQLPPGKWRLAVAKGVEYHPAFEVIDIKAGQTVDRRIVMRRWVNMAQRGWYSGDDHVHHPRTRSEHDEMLMTWLRAEDLHVANILQQGDVRGSADFRQAGFGPQHQYRREDRILVSGQEEPSNAINEQGHALALNISAPVQDLSQYHLYDVAFDAAHGQGGVTGYAHVAWALASYRKVNPASHATWDPSINVIRGKVDFLEILQFGILGLEDYYDFLNLGYKLGASAGSDVPWGVSPGEVRVYAYTGRDFSARTWFASLKKGQTFITNGPMIEFTVDGMLPGNEIAVARNQRVRVRARAWAPEAIGSPKNLEVVSQGRVLRAVESFKPGQSELEIDFHMPAAESQWLAARATSHNQAVAHTSPVYLSVNGQSFQDKKTLADLVARRVRVLDYVSGRLADRRFTSAFAPGEVQALAARVREARSLLERKLGR